MMRKFIFAALSAFFSLSAHAVAVNYFGCDCQAGAGASCATYQGSDAYNGLSRYPGKQDDGVTVNAAYGPKQTITAMSTLLNSAGGDSTVKSCRFGKWPESVAGAPLLFNFSNNNSSRTHPVTLGSYDLPGLTGDSGSGAGVSYTESTATDTTKAWTVNQWAGWQLKVLTNNDRQEHTQIVLIASNTATTLTFRSGSTATGVQNERLIKPVPINGNAYTIEQAFPEFTSTNPANTNPIVKANPGTLAHREGLIVRDVRLVGHTDLPAISGITVDAAGTVTVTTVTNHGLAVGDLVAIIAATCSGAGTPCATNSRALLTGGAAVRAVPTLTTFTYWCGTTQANATTVCGGGTAGGSPYGRKEAQVLAFIDRDQDFITFDNVTLDGGAELMQANGSLGNISYTPGTSDNLSSNLKVINSRLKRGGSIATLVVGNGLYFAKNLFWHNGTTIFDHHLYLGGSARKIQPLTGASITGDGTTATLTFSAPTNATGTTSYGVTVTEASIAACNSSVTMLEATFVDALTFTYPASGCSGTPTGITVDVQENARSVNQVIYRNTFVDANVDVEGVCAEAAFVIHGRKQGLLVVDNDVYENTPSADGRCWGISATPGGYSGVETQEQLDNVYMIGNRVSGFPLPIAMDICVDCIIASNWVTVSSALTGMTGIRLPGVDYALPTSRTRNDHIQVLYNTVLFPAPDAGSIGIEFSRDGTRHKLVGNYIYFKTGWTTATSCFSSDGSSSGSLHANPLPASAFDEWDYNGCYGEGQGASKPKWNNGTMSGVVRSTLALQQAVGLDLHSTEACQVATLVSTAASGYDLSFAAGTCAETAGDPTVKPPVSMFMRKRSTATLGAYDPGAATTRLPGPATAVSP